MKEALVGAAKCTVELCGVCQILPSRMKSAEQCRPPFGVNDRFAFELLTNTVNS